MITGWSKEKKEKLLKELRDDFPDGGCECHPTVSALMKELEEEIMMKVKAYVLLKKHLEELNCRGDTYTQEAYDSVKRQLKSMKVRRQPVSDNFDRTLPPAGKIIEVEEDDKGVLVTVEISKRFKPKGLGFGSAISGSPGQIIKSIDLFEFSILKHPDLGSELLEEEE